MAQLSRVESGSTDDTVSGNVARYYYDGMAKRVRKESQSGGRVYLYDRFGNLISEISLGGAFKADYVYLNGRPLVKMLRHYDETIRGSRSDDGDILEELDRPPGETISPRDVYYYLVDHLGTPMAMTDEQKQIRWQADYCPFGETFNELAGVKNGLRFPGQFHDEETGLYYNWHRYYDPGTGRYLAPDPLRLDGGANLFVYAHNNPAVYIDPDGRIAWTALIPCIKGAITSFLADIGVQTGECCWKQHGWKMWKCDLGACPPLNKCSLAVSAVVGCATGYLRGAPPTTLAGLKIVLRKLGAKAILKFLAKLGC